jgi:hypothetical protein
MIASDAGLLSRGGQITKFHVLTDVFGFPGMLATSASDDLLAAAGPV